MGTKTEKSKYYSLDNILKENATYNMIIGERSNGKTYSVLKYSIVDYWENGNEFALIRRYGLDISGARASLIFEAINNNDEISKITGGKFTFVYYRASRFWLAKYDEKLDKNILDSKPFAYAFSLNATEHDKSTSYPRVKNILFDEFLTRDNYLPDEFILFMNTLSTIIRENDGVKIFMCANTVNKYAPYFSEMGITNISNMKQGTIDLYRYGNTELTVAVEYCKPNKKGKKSDKYFAFNNPKLAMITGGAWEIQLYPLLPFRYKLEDIKFRYYVEFDRSILECEVVKCKHDGVKCVFTYVHIKTTPLQGKKKDVIFTTGYSPKPNAYRRLGAPKTRLEQILYQFFREEKVFYQSNEVGEIMRNYLNWCQTQPLI